MSLVKIAELPRLLVATCRKHAAVSSRLAALAAPAALNVTIQPRLARLASSRATLAILAILVCSIHPP